jgi:hypothetical protein
VSFVSFPHYIPAEKWTRLHSSHHPLRSRYCQRYLRAGLSIPLNPEFASLQASPLSSPTQLTRRLPRTHSRSQLSSRASLESIIEESSNDNFEHTATHATSNPTPDFTGAKERNRLTVSRPPGWNGKKGITTGRGMRDVCGIWYVGYSAWYYSPVSISQ